MNSKYNDRAKGYDLLDVIYFKDNGRNPRRVIANMINKQDLMILDICTGTAANAIAVAKRNINAQIVGIDISQEMLHIAETKIKENGLNNIQLCQMDATKTTFKDESFDVILISLVLHEITEGLADSIMLEAKRIVKPEGRILVVEWEEPRSKLQKILFYLIRKTEPKGFEQFLKKDMKQYFNKFQLKIADTTHCDYTKVLTIKHSETEL